MLRKRAARRRRSYFRISRLRKSSAGLLLVVQTNSVVECRGRRWSRRRSGSRRAPAARPGVDRWFPPIRAMSSSRIRWPPLSGGSSPSGAREAAALVLAAHEFVANGGRRPSRRPRQSAASPGGTGSRGRVGGRGSLRSEPAVVRGPTWCVETAGLHQHRQSGRRRRHCCSSACSWREPG